jgi:hypothetical protein
MFFVLEEKRRRIASVVYHSQKIWRARVCDLGIAAEEHHASVPFNF